MTEKVQGHVLSDRERPAGKIREIRIGSLGCDSELQIYRAAAVQTNANHIAVGVRKGKDEA
jgi:hypothetical protein